MAGGRRRRGEFGAWEHGGRLGARPGAGAEGVAAHYSERVLGLLKQHVARADLRMACRDLGPLIKHQRLQRGGVFRQTVIPFQHAYCIAE